MIESNEFLLGSFHFIKVSPTIKIRQNDESHKVVEYAVYGFIIHTGTEEAGHYTCFFRRSDSENINEEDDKYNSWYLFDDDKVEQKKWSEIVEYMLTTQLLTVKMVFLSRIDDKSEDDECDKCDGIEMIRPIGDLEDDLTLRQYNMYFPPLFKEFDDYKKDTPKKELREKEFKAEEIKPIKCECGKLYYPF